MCIKFQPTIAYEKKEKSTVNAVQLVMIRLVCNKSITITLTAFLIFSNSIVRHLGREKVTK